MLKRFLNNWSLKLTALVVAIFLWSHVRGQVNPWEVTSFKVPLKAQPPHGIVLGENSRLPKTVIVTVRGPRLTLRSIKGPTPINPLATTDAPTPLNTGQVQATLDFTGVHPGIQSLAVNASTNSYDLDVVGVNPSDVRVDIETP
jgi:YbbR domain-containing protein